MRERGERLAGIRIDSGDLAWLATYARKELDAAGLTDCKIVLSNDLDEYTIKSIRDQGAQVDAWGVGTKLATAFDQPSLGGVYKLSATKKNPDAEWEKRLKISEQAVKLTVPGVLDVRRYTNEEGYLVGDMVFDTTMEANADGVIVDPADILRSKTLDGYTYETLLQPLARDGQVVLPEEFRSAMKAQKRVTDGLEHLDESQKRLLNPHSYPVGLEENLWHDRARMVQELRGCKNPLFV